MRTNRVHPGAWCVVRDVLAGRTIVEALVVEGGVRLQTGEHFGEKRAPGEYELLEVVEATPTSAGVLAEVWA